MLDGACDVEKLVHRVKELGMPAVAMTDHGNIFGAVHFVNAANVIIKDLWPIQSRGFRVEMNRVKNTERDDTRQLMQLAKQKCRGEFDRHL